MLTVTIEFSDGRSIALGYENYQDYLQALHGVGSVAFDAMEDGWDEARFHARLTSKFVDRLQTIVTDLHPPIKMPLWPRIAAICVALLWAFVVTGEIVHSYRHGSWSGIQPVKIIDGQHVGLSGNIVSTPHAFNGWNTIATVNVPADAMEIRRRYGDAGAKYVAQLLRERELGVGPRMWVKCWSWQLFYYPEKPY